MAEHHETPQFVIWLLVGGFAAFSIGVMARDIYCKWRQTESGVKFLNWCVSAKDSTQAFLDWRNISTCFRRRSRSPEPDAEKGEASVEMGDVSAEMGETPKGNGGVVAPMPMPMPAPKALDRNSTPTTNKKTGHGARHFNKVRSADDAAARDPTRTRPLLPPLLGVSTSRPPRIPRLEFEDHGTGYLAPPPSPSSDAQEGWKKAELRGKCSRGIRAAHLRDSRSSLRGR
ncbi:hypothetical protein QBC33DRAFT_563190 [Phialemonium atrogriseum]|uniref:Uncharacterized protein n=1 Tax=Phialemonium atrogriseum TaxID=1093897 RepID=A0AAJ0BTS4_9PEZI|nr:uncharacterized protein QBC33DRAFT_563190 [Phialemonium atrogriseum]KAK1762979.1 hypothetical protein QBC33DRAFT_563190 [Phialemonium atrogriseum]